jgi:hypothetical protein
MNFSELKIIVIQMNSARSRRKIFKTQQMRRSWSQKAVFTPWMRIVLVKNVKSGTMAWARMKKTQKPMTLRSHSQKEKRRVTTVIFGSTSGNWQLPREELYISE